jgi:hypothetical protein
MRLLKRKGLLDEDSHILFDSLRTARNAVLHGAQTVSEDEARDYVDQARFLRDLLAERLPKLE